MVEVSPLLRQLLLAAVDMPAQYDREGRDGALARLLLHEVDRAPALPLHIRCRATRGWGVVPGLHGGAGHPLAAAGLGRAAAHEPAQLQPPFPRAHRHVLRPRRQRACVVLALARLAAGDPVTVIALDFGYQGPAAFSTMFRRVLGAAPSAYLRTD